MNSPSIHKDLRNYINTDIFVLNLNLPTFSITDDSSFSDKDEKLFIINERLHLLLKLPHQEFWCQVLYDQSVLRSLQSFFNNAKRPHEFYLEKTILSDTEKEIYKSYYKLILRLTTHKECNVKEFSPSNFGSLLYDNYIIDVPTLFDICSIYGEENSAIISKLICGVIACQSLYINDFKDYTNQTIRFIQDKLVDISANGLVKSTNCIKTKVNQHLLTKNTTAITTEIDIINLLFFLIDLFRNWSIFLNSIESNEEIFTTINIAQFHKTVENVFEKIVPFCQQRINKFDSRQPDKIKTLLSTMCSYLIGTWRQIFESLYGEKLRSNKVGTRSSEENYSLISECLAMISACQENPLFADALYLLHPLEKDVFMLEAAVRSDENEYYSEYVSEAIKEVQKIVQSRNTIFSSNHLPPVGVMDSSGPRHDLGASASDQADMAQVRDIFPELSDDDINAYTKSYKCSTSCMLESLLDGAIDTAYVKDVSTNYMNEQYISRVEEDLVTESILKNHRNIYDGDEIDTGMVKRSQIHQGKRQTNLEATIDPTLKNMILNIVSHQDEEEQMLPENENTTYNDEFDDVYGISHDGVIDAKPTEDDTTAPVTQRAHRMAPVAPPPAPEPRLMEPSAVRHSEYASRQWKKKRFQDSNHHGQQGPMGHRQGSHGLPQNQDARIKKDHRPKGARRDGD